MENTQSWPDQYARHTDDPKWAEVYDKVGGGFETKIKKVLDGNFDYQINEEDHF